jgi:ABC-type dipeptide/oligopeptide/nickel transport system permease component
MTSASFDSLAWPSKMGDVAAHMILPVTVLVLGALPVLLRHERSAVCSTLLFCEQRKGTEFRGVACYTGYALPAAANPIVSLFGFSFGTLLSASLLIEIVMSWPGLGPFLAEAILARDLYVVVAGVLLSTVFLVGGNLIADLLLYWVDPRIRVGLGSR